ncbi:hypothetical protein V6N13_124202 [Hibiscus sabdariffa]
MYSNFKEQAIEEAITQKFIEYVCCVEKICIVFDEGGLGPASGEDNVVATGPKSKPKNGSSGGEVGDGEDLEQAKLRVVLE